MQSASVRGSATRGDRESSQFLSNRMSNIVDNKLDSNGSKHRNGQINTAQLSARQNKVPVNSDTHFLGSEIDDEVASRVDQHNQVPETTKKSQKRREDYLHNLINSKMSDKTNVLSRMQ